jgi:DNA polymerase III alpha subunit (gram-positive type)
MNVQNLINADELYFIDIETVGGMGICQIGITRWSREEQRLSIVFNEIINPEIPSDKINIHAIKVHGISEYTWSSAKAFDSFHSRIKNILDGKIVLQWGGGDMSLINKNIDWYNLDAITATSLNSWAYHYKGMKLARAAQEQGINFTGNHRAGADSYVAALIFTTDKCGYKITITDQKIIDSFNTQARNRSRSEGFKTGSLLKNEKGEDVCLTGFTGAEKERFGKLLVEKGFNVRAGVTSGLRYLITPTGSYSRSPGKEAFAKKNGVKVVDLNSFLQIV